MYIDISILTTKNFENNNIYSILRIYYFILLYSNSHSNFYTDKYIICKNCLINFTFIYIKHKLYFLYN